MKKVITMIAAFAFIVGAGQIYSKTINYSICVAADPLVNADKKTKIDYFGTYKIDSAQSLGDCKRIGTFPQGSQDKTNKMLVTFPDGTTCDVNVRVKLKEDVKLIGTKAVKVENIHFSTASPNCMIKASDQGSDGSGGRVKVTQVKGPSE